MTHKNEVLWHNKATNKKYLTSNLDKNIDSSLEKLYFLIMYVSSLQGNPQYAFFYRRTWSRSVILHTREIIHKKIRFQNQY